MKEAGSMLIPRAAPVEQRNIRVSAWTTRIGSRLTGPEARRYNSWLVALIRISWADEHLTP